MHIIKYVGNYNNVHIDRWFNNIIRISEMHKHGLQ